MEQQNIGEIFLINFFKSVLSVKTPLNNLQNSKEEYEQMERSNLKPESPKIQMVPQIIKTINIKKNLQQTRNNFPLMTSRHTLDQKQLLSNEKINYLIKNQSISEIECIGADNPLMIKIRGMTQKTQVKLTIEEIYDLIAEFSQKTKIPVINGSIKAALNNLIITAALSETLGPRFILQKKRQNNTQFY